MRNHLELHITPDDLWPGATIDDCRAVAASLKAAGVRSYSTDRVGETNIADHLEAVDAFRAAVLTQAQRRISEGKTALETGRLQELETARRRHQRALQRRDAAQEELDAAVSRMRELGLLQQPAAADEATSDAGRRRWFNLG
jgi:hypothetical protein